MTYARMDHADWVQRQIAVSKRQKLTKAEARKASAGIGWRGAPDVLNDFQAKAFDILGMVAGGIYNAPISWNTLDWCAGHGIRLNWRGDLSTFDFMGLTRFVFLCHAARIRGSVGGGAPRCIEIIMSPRADFGGMSRRHPNLSEAVAEFWTYLPADHRILHRPALTIDPPKESAA